MSECYLIITTFGSSESEYLNQNGIDLLLSENTLRNVVGTMFTIRHS